MDNEEMGVGIYVRKSTDRQELSLPAQERHIMDFLKREGINLPVKAVYQDILSGKRSDRTGYQRMLMDARLGLLKMIVFHKVNRFGRNTAEGIAAMEELRRLGVTIRVTDMPALDISTPEGAFLFTFMLGQGQYEVENLSSEARKGMEQKVIQGGWSWRAPDGYVNRRREIAPRKFHAWIEVDPERAAIVRLVFRWYASGTTTLRGICRRLTRLHEQRCQLGKSGCLRRGGLPWSVQAVYKMLTNRFYIGDVVVPSWNMTVTGKHQPIISKARFDQVERVLKQQGNIKQLHHFYLLQDMLQLVGEPPIPLRSTTVQRRGHRYYYYYYFNATQRRCYLPVDRVETEVVSTVRERLASLLGDDPIGSLSTRLKHVVIDMCSQAEARAANIQRERQRLLHLGRRGIFREQEIEAEMKALEKEEQLARVELHRAQTFENSHAPLIVEAASVLQSMARWDQLTLLQQRKTLRYFITRVDIRADGSIVDLYWQPMWDSFWLHSS